MLTVLGNPDQPVADISESPVMEIAMFSVLISHKSDTLGAGLKVASVTFISNIHSAHTFISLPLDHNRCFSFPFSIGEESMSVFPLLPTTPHPIQFHFIIALSSAHSWLKPYVLIRASVQSIKSRAAVQCRYMKDQPPLCYLHNSLCKPFSL